jgi:3',5'-cyclic-nucleotide phosphodiesterase
VAAAPPPAFELTALGVLGGDWDDDLSSFLLGRPDQPATLLIDGGSVMSGIARMLEKKGRLAPTASVSTRTRAALEVLRPVRAILLTHAHIDHLAGFIVTTTLELALAQAGRPPLEVVGLPETIAAVHGAALSPPLWADFTAVPPDNPALRLVPLAPGAARAAGGFTVSAVPLAHPVPSAALFVEAGEAVYLHLGDTGPTAAVWDAARPLLRAGRLRALAVEVSFPARDEVLAARSGHLTPRTLVVELAKLAGLPAPADGDGAALAARVAPALGGLPIIVLHIKALAYDDVVAELAPLRGAGLRLIVPERGERYRF